MKLVHRYLSLLQRAIKIPISFSFWGDIGKKHWASSLQGFVHWSWDIKLHQGWALEELLLWEAVEGQGSGSGSGSGSVLP